MFIPPSPAFSGWSAARRGPYRRLEIAKFRVAIAAISDEKGYQPSDAVDVGAIDY
jgi:hypothetical protein